MDKHKDFYDYLVGEYGIDNTIFFDRRGSKIVTQDTLIREIVGVGGQSLRNMFPDETKIPRRRRKVYSGYRNYKYYGVLEVGYYQYIFIIKNITREVIEKVNYDRYDTTGNNVKIVYDSEIELFHTFDNHMHYFPSPINLYPVSLSYNRKYNIGNMKNLNYKNDFEHVEINDVIQKPILYASRIPKIIDAQTVYFNIYNYISSKKDFDIKDTRGDVAKAVDHGFDKITSFRNM
jgi:hypothetical protein